MKHKINTVARLTGFKPDLLRSWERRHGLLRPERTEGGHRLYTDDDLAVLQAVRRLMSEGRSIGAIAQTGREELLASSRRRRGPASDHWQGPRPALRRLTDEEIRARKGDLVRAAVQVDQPRLMRHLRELFETTEPRQAVEEVLQPVGERIGELWREGVCSIAGEHLASSAIRGRLLDLLSREVGLQDSRTGLRVVVACFPGELHENPALQWALGLTWEGRRVIWLGGDLPFSELGDACDRLMPDEIHLSVMTRETFERSRVEYEAFVAKWERRVRVVVGGGGVPDVATVAEAG
jgi:DNA-binding transcriptional MerR regulator